MNNFDPQNFKSRDAASYDAVTEQFDYFTERYILPFAEKMLSLAEISDSDSVLDIGTGTGVVSLRAASRVNSDKDGNVYAIDLSDEMLAAAKAKARSLGIEQKVNFLKMDAEALQFEDEKFNVGLSLFSLLHFPDPLLALKELYRVLQPGGRLVLAVGSGAPLFSLPGIVHLAGSLPQILRKLRGLDLTMPDFLDSLVERHIPKREIEESSFAAHHFRAKSAVSLIKNAGFDVLKTGWTGHQAVINSAEEFWEIQRTFSSVSRKRISSATSEEVNTLYKNFMDECRRVQSAGGRLLYPIGAFYIKSKRPEK